MSALAAIFLFLHVLGAVVAFGPSFAFPVMGRLAGREPRYAPALITATVVIEKGLVLPLAIFQGVTGVGLILTLGINLFDGPFHWLLAGIILYVVAIILAFGVQYPTGEKMLHFLAGMPAGGPPPGPPAGGPPPGPPAELMALVKRAQQTGMALAVLLVAIIFLMAVKPSF